jgi:hypothetical protein
MELAKIKFSSEDTVNLGPVLRRFDADWDRHFSQALSVFRYIEADPRFTHPCPGEHGHSDKRIYWRRPRVRRPLKGPMDASFFLGYTLEKAQLESEQSKAKSADEEDRAHYQKVGIT